MDAAFPSPLLVLFGQSVLIGLSIAAPVGQIGTLAIQRTLDGGRGAGLATGLGAALADAVYGAIGAFGATSLIQALMGARTWLTLAGAAFLLYLAWRIASQPVIAAARSEASPGTLLRHLGGTFLLTLANPTTILSFMAVFAALAGTTPQASPWAMVAGVLVGSALWWLVLTAGVSLLRQRFDARWRRTVNRVSAALLVGMGLWQLGQLWQLWQLAHRAA